MISEKVLSSIAVGKAGELRVRSELILQGFHPAVCDFDDGTDIILDNGVKIGVKTASRPTYHKQSYAWRYHFSIKVTQVRKGNGNGIYKKKYVERNWKNYVDYWIVWCIQDNFFYIVPSKEIKKKFAIIIPAPDEKRKYQKHTWKETKSKYEKYKNNWKQLDRSGGLKI